MANELLPFEVSDPYLGFKAKGMLTNANYHVKKTTLLLFINGGFLHLPIICGLLTLQRSFCGMLFYKERHRSDVFLVSSQGRSSVCVFSLRD